MTAHPAPAGHMRIGIVSTRIGTTNGASLAAKKWCRVWTRTGHTCFYFAFLERQLQGLLESFTGEDERD